MAYLDVEAMLVTYINTRRGVRTVTELPADLSSLPVVQVRRIAGGDRDVVIDTPIVDVDVFHVDRSTAHILAEQIRTDFRTNLTGYKSGTGVVALVETINGPYWVPYDNTNLRRYTASYRVTVHSAP